MYPYLMLFLKLKISNFHKILQYKSEYDSL